MTPRERLLRKISADNQSGCWNWVGYICPEGYGRIWFNGGNPPAHRASWEIENGPIPDGLHVCHHCDNRRCVNPDHLFLGTNAENMADRNAKGRARGGSSPGEKHPSAKLSQTDVLAIRALRGSERVRETARRYGVSPSRVSMIQTGKTWSHLQ